MASTRYTQQQPPPPLQIYQDPPTSFDRAPMPTGQRTKATKSGSPLRPIKNAASRRNIIFNPPHNMEMGKKPPMKSAQPSSSSPSRAPFGNRLNMIAMPPPGASLYSTDSMEKREASMSKFKTAPQKALFTTFSSTRSAGKENHPQTLYPAPPNPYKENYPISNFSLEGLYGAKPTPKRKLLEAAQIQDTRTFRQVKMEDNSQEPSVELPEPDAFPELHDDGTKPGHSYAQLIGMSILRAPNRRLTLSQIYNWISTTFSYYNAAEAGWQNSIRHNLSLNKAFIKQERPKEDPGKGNYWAIEPGMEHQFMKDMKCRKSTGAETPSLTAVMTPATHSENSQPMLLPAPPELPVLEPSYTPTESQRPVSTAPGVSSDATIPASDVLEEPEEDEYEEPASPQAIHSSPPPMMHSSPPVTRRSSRRDDTPPPVPRFPSSSQGRTHKRKIASMDDSGYFSSLDSSALHPHRAGRLLTSEDRPRIKRGRAEEEIARLRGSSYDSPTKGSRAIFSQSSVFAPASSSPLRRGNGNTQMLPPLTPAVKLKAPVRPPQSVSPNTNLRLHRDRVRELVGSPVRGLTVLEENLPWSPAFHLDENTTMFYDFGTDFDIFADTTAGLLSVPANGSPEKRSAKRPRIDRSKSANILADISNNASKNATPTPKLSFTPNIGGSIFDSPTKGFSAMDSPSKLLGLNSPSKSASSAYGNANFDLPHDDFLGAEFLAEDVTDFSGVDITQGFQKIGAGGYPTRTTPKGKSRPSMGRSFTSRF
ncbi:Forkhead protein sep1 [Phlyctema vagabunda]|uniref:Forkhead protein sep1 n=1 Tax=Phlyctema vagabunda TaxID=108571 RepID=A0ABR4PUM2_9HELO